MIETREALRLIRTHEGFRHTSYLDTAGIPTIGYGFNQHQIHCVSKLEYITREDAERLLRRLVMELSQQLKTRVKTYSKLSFRRKAVLIDMAYNLGVRGLMRFVKMMKALERRDYSRAAHEMLDSRWAVVVKTRATTLSRIMKTG